jgi:membrane associated rhomboid family serine protease
MFPIRDHNPSGSFPLVTVLLIAVNALVFLVTHVGQSAYDNQVITLTWGLIPARISAGQGYETLLTSMFLHGSWMHILGNMLFLWIFGDNMEDRMGRLGFLAFYLASGLAAALAQYAMDPASRLPMVGASGAIAGVLGGYLLLYPRAQVDVLVILMVFWRIFAVPAWVVLCFWFGSQIFAGLATPVEAGGVAYWAHIGGFVAGLGLTFLLVRREPEPDAIFGPPPGPGHPRPGAAPIVPPAPGRQGSIVPLVRRRR